MIDMYGVQAYHLNQYETITDEYYEEFTTIDPRAKRALPRQRAIATGET